MYIGTGTSATLTGVGIGKATITVTTEDGGFKATCTVLVPGVVIPGNSVMGTSAYGGVIVFGKSDNLVPVPIYISVFPSEILNYVKDVSWSGYDGARISIQSDKTDVSKSTITIKNVYEWNTSTSATVTLTNGQQIVTNSVNLKRQSAIFGSVNGVTVSANSSTSITVQRGSLTAISVAANNKMTGGTLYPDTNVQWSSTDDEIAVVVNDGGNLKIRALKEGSCDIVAKAAWDLTKTASIHVTVTE